MHSVDIQKKLHPENFQKLERKSDFAPKYLGFGHITKKSIRQPLQTFFLVYDLAVCVNDGIYIYIEKSSNYFSQPRSFSIHKGCPLVKPILLLASEVICYQSGPYLTDGKNSDAKITDHNYA